MIIPLVFPFYFTFGSQKGEEVDIQPAVDVEGIVKIYHIRGHDDVTNAVAEAIISALASETGKPDIVLE